MDWLTVAEVSSDTQNYSFVGFDPPDESSSEKDS